MHKNLNLYLSLMCSAENAAEPAINEKTPARAWWIRGYKY